MYQFILHYNKGLFNMCNITHVKATKNNSKFLLKINNYLLENNIFYIKCTSSKSKLLF